jgi:5-methylcytosine-specific restriction endonuclease McrA
VALFLAAGGRCAECGAPLAPRWHADHVTPVAAGGTTEPANGQALCPRCNLRKGSRT